MMKKRGESMRGRRTRVTAVLAVLILAASACPAAFAAQQFVEFTIPACQ